MADTGHNPKRYREMSEPYPNYEEASKAIDAFYDELTALRAKHRIADVYFVMSTSYALSDGDQTNAMVIGHLGDSLKKLQMAAYGYGTAQEEHRATIEQLASGKKRK